MARSHSFDSVTLSTLAGCFLVLSACGSDAHLPGSVVSAGGETAQAGASTVNGNVGDGGRGEAGDASQPGSGDAGEGGGAGANPLAKPRTPLAVYPSTLEANLACDASPDAMLLIENAGGSLLTITSASADSGYVVKTLLPLSIEPDATAVLLVAPPAVSADAPLGEKSGGTLSFRTNEPALPEHHVSLSSELFRPALEFTDHDGTPLTAPLTLAYLNDDVCPDAVKYRVHNRGNLAVTLIGPAFSANFGGTTTGAAGQSIAPGADVELVVGGVSAPGNVCGGTGQLTFATKGSYCGAPPSLSVIWPASAGPTCACAVAE